MFFEIRLLNKMLEVGLLAGSYLKMSVFDQWAKGVSFLLFFEAERKSTKISKIAW